MSLYKKVKIPKKNLPDSIDSLTFKENWLKALSLNEKDVLYFLNYLESFYDFVNASLKNYNTPNYFLLSTLSLIDNCFEIAFTKLKLWLKSVDVIHETKIIVFERVNKIKKIPKKARPLMAEYYFILDFKYALSKKIKQIKIKQFYPNSKKYNCYYISDPLINLTNWQKYLLKLLYLGYNNTEISKITQLSRKTIIKERKKLYVYV